MTDRNEFKPGWLEEVFEKVNEEVAKWPDSWKRMPRKKES